MDNCASHGLPQVNLCDCFPTLPSTRIDDLIARALGQHLLKTPELLTQAAVSQLTMQAGQEPPSDRATTVTSWDTRWDKAKYDPKWPISAILSTLLRLLGSLRRFLVWQVYYRRFCRPTSRPLRPSHLAPSGAVTYNWTTFCQAAFNQT
ncbi:hypothetical protein GWK47_033716 [Chionoecetes opilio]|uniref:Uncharacterized protein n=1 Tax=Chionoecetes opilio TaxID=41210 RepID=A0A8J5D115_CHIOP|nr:hypothetical protein GWK47_033716 [Chionoecetes opilio]